MQQPSPVHRDYVVSVTIARELERVRPFAFAPAVPGVPADIDLVRRRLVWLTPLCIHDHWHGVISDKAGAYKRRTEKEINCPVALIAVAEMSPATVCPHLPVRSF